MNGMSKKTAIVSWAINLAALFGLYTFMNTLIASGTLGRYEQGVLMMVFINIILAVSLNLATGFLGQLALGHAGFMSVGAYVGAIFSKSVPIADPTLQLVAAMVVGGLAAALCGVIIGIPALRLKGDYLAIITLGFGEIIRVIIENLSITGGGAGLRSIPRIAKLPFIFWVMVVIIALLYTLIRSRHGRAIIAIREDEVAAEASGVNTTYYKTLAFAIAALLAGVAGAIYAHHLGILGAKTFDFNRSIEIVVIVVLGGMGSLTGSILAAIGLTLLPELLRGFSEYRMVLYSIALILIMIFKPSGLMGTREFSLTALLRRIFIRSSKKVEEPREKALKNQREEEAKE